MMILGYPYCAVSLFTAAKHDFVSQESTTFVCDDLVVKYVQIQHHLFLKHKNKLISISAK